MVRKDGDLGERIKRHRLEKRMSLRNLGAKTGLAPSFLSDIERGIRRPSLDSLERISEVLGINMSELFAAGGEPTTSIDLYELLNDKAIALVYKGEPLRSDERQQLLNMLDAALSLRKVPEPHAEDGLDIERMAAHMEGDYGKAPSPALRQLISEIVREVREEYRRQEG